MHRERGIRLSAACCAILSRFDGACKKENRCRRCDLFHATGDVTSDRGFSMRTDGDAPVAGGPPPLFAQSRVPRLGDPVVLLREKFHIDLPACMLQPFGKSGQYRFLSKDIYPWRPVWPSEGDCAFSLYFELANRICFLEHLSVLHPHARLVIYRCLDSLILLSIFSIVLIITTLGFRSHIRPICKWSKFCAKPSLPHVVFEDTIASF